MLKDLVKVANRLDSLGLTKEADAIDGIISKEASDGAYHDYKGDPRGIGTTEPMFAGQSPEQDLINRLKAKDILEKMSDKDFRAFREKYPEAIEDLFSEGNLFEVSNINRVSSEPRINHDVLKEAYEEFLKRHLVAKSVEVISLSWNDSPEYSAYQVKVKVNPEGGESYTSEDLIWPVENDIGSMTMKLTGEDEETYFLYPEH